VTSNVAGVARSQRLKVPFVSRLRKRQGQPQALIAFVHIPRTGGGTLSTAVAKNYAPQRSPGNYQRGPEKTRNALARIAANPGTWQAVGDHVPYGLYLRYLPADTRYITVLREPVDRVLSHYHFHAQAGSAASSGATKLRKMWQDLLTLERIEREGGEDTGEKILLPADAEFSLEEGLRRRICIYDNFMTRFLWGGESLFGELPPDALERAKRNIENFWFVGLRERLDESIVLLGQKLGVGLMPYYLRHVSQKRPPLEETSEELRAMIAEYNSLDVELYAFARERFEAESPGAEEMADQVDKLKRRSVAVTRRTHAARVAKKEHGKARRRAEKAERSAQRRAAAAEGRVTNGGPSQDGAARGPGDDDSHIAEATPSFAPQATPQATRRGKKTRKKPRPKAQPKAKARRTRPTGARRLLFRFGSFRSKSKGRRG
jgi:hypothetical protein